MSLIEEIKKLTASLSLVIGESQGIYHISVNVAQRKTYLSKQKLEYHARFRIDDSGKTIKFTEMLVESKSGLSSGVSSSEFGSHAMTYNLHDMPKKSTIEEQSSLFGERYEYSYDFSSIRDQIEVLAGKAGYQLKYQVSNSGI